MNEILIFGGTSEAKKLTEELDKRGFQVTVTVASYYGTYQMEGFSENVKILEGRLSEKEMSNLLNSKTYSYVIDATHPYAVKVSEQIGNLVKGRNDFKFFRLKRDTSYKNIQNAVYFKSFEDCASELKNIKSNVLLTTGSKELNKFKGINNSNIYVRVLPSIESLNLCNENGFEGKQIIAAQGPFTKEFNKSLLEQYNIDILVTKETGTNGGFEDKVAAVDELHKQIWIISNPDKTNGFSLEDILKSILKEYNKKQTNVNIIGLGPGSLDFISNESLSLINSCDYIFGAKRMIEQFKVKSFPIYDPDEILNKIIELEDDFGGLNICILVSGDTGFFSLTKKLIFKLNNYNLNIIPGISSVSYFSSKIGIPWGECFISSLHGKKDDRQYEINKWRKYSKIIAILSNFDDIEKIYSSYKIDKFIIGYNLSYSDEYIKDYSEVKDFKDGLYICYIEKPVEPSVFIKDSQFNRLKAVPMTKEFVRNQVISELLLDKAKVIYDVGCGTGSISIQASKFTNADIYSIDNNPEAINVCNSNNIKFNANINVIEGCAPEVFDTLPNPDVVFIGGTKGNLLEIIDAIHKKTSVCHFVMTLFTFETLSDFLSLLSKRKFNNIQYKLLQVSESTKLGSYTALQPNNPIYLISFDFGEIDE